MHEDLPKVSIGLITYNHADFIVECLDSIRNQTYQNIELFISDDCSSDNTQAIIQSYMERYPGLVAEFLPQPTNIGISRNCNILLERFTGKYGHIFSGDDIMLPEKTSLQVKALEENPDAVLCFTNIEWFWSGTNKKISNHFGWLQQPSTKLEDIIADFSIPTPSCMISLKKCSGLSYNLDLKYVNDFLFVAEVMLRGRAIYLDEVTVRYRKHKNSLTMKNYFYQDRCKVVELFKARMPREYGPSIKKYAKIVEYSLVMELIANGKKKEALKRMRLLFPQAISSPKWLARLSLCFLKMVKS